jgi:hypothetical protein
MAETVKTPEVVGVVIALRIDEQKEKRKRKSTQEEKKQKRTNFA